MDSEKKIIVYRGYVYESENKQLNDRELKAVYDNLYTSLKGLSAAMNLVKDKNARKSLASDMMRIRRTFNEKIKDPEKYAPKSVEQMTETAKTVDAQMKEKQGISDFSHNDDATFEDKSSMNP